MIQPETNPPLAPATPSERSFTRLVLLALAVLTLIRTYVAGTTLLSADEAYYWNWIHPLQLSYFDHPAMVAYWIWGATRLLGESELGVRLPAVLGGIVTTALMWDAALQAFRSRRVAALSALWLNCTLLFCAATVIITPDTPLLVFWMAALWGALRLIKSGQARWIYVVGLALGLGAISKYTMALIAPGLLVTLLVFQPLRRWLKSPHLWLAGLLAAITASPVLIWNMQNNYASFQKQLGHAFDTEITHPWRNFLEFFGSQVGLVTPLMFGFVVWGMGWALWQGWKQRRPDWFLLGATSLPLLLFFLQHTRSGIVQPHWGGPAYLSGVIAAVGAWHSLKQPRLSALFRLAAPLGALVSLLVYFQAATALLPIPIKIDALKRLGGWDELAVAVDGTLLSHPGAFLLAHKHDSTGALSYYVQGHPPVFQRAGHVLPSYYTAEEVLALPGKDALFVTEAKDDGSSIVAQAFDNIELLKTVDLHWGKQVAERYRIYLCRNYKGGLMRVGKGVDGALDPVRQ